MSKNNKLESRAVTSIIKLHLGELGTERDVHAIGFEVLAANRDGLHGMADTLSTNGEYPHSLSITELVSNSTGNVVRVRTLRHLELLDILVIGRGTTNRFSDNEREASLLVSTELGVTGEFDLVLFKVTTGDGYSLDSLVDRRGTSSEHLRGVTLTSDVGDGSGDGLGVRSGRDLEDTVAVTERGGKREEREREREGLEWRE